MDMSEVYEIQLGEKRTVNSINVDEYLYTKFDTSSKEILPYDQTSVINAAQLFDDERQDSQIYRFYGCVNFMSVINGLKKTYKGVDDFFKRPKIGDEANGLTKSLINSFDIYLCRPMGNVYSGSSLIISGNTKLNASEFQLKYQILSNLSSCEVYKSGYGKNIYNDQQYSFSFSVDIDVTNLYDSFHKPLTQLYLFFKYKPTLNGATPQQMEKLFENMSTDGETSTIDPVPITTTGYTAGNLVKGDWVNYVSTNFEEIVSLKKEYYVQFYCSGSTGQYLQFKYYPFVPLKLRDWGDEFITGNISGTSETDAQIPNYAVKIDNNGNYLWKDLLQNGYIDPISNKGVNYSFINKRHYVFSNIVLPLKPDLEDSNTSTVFTEIKFGPNTKRFNKPTSDLNNLGNKC